MGLIFHVLLALTFATLTLHLPLRLPQSGITLAINSTLEDQNIDIFISVQAHIGSEIKLFSEALSPQLGTHTLTVEEKQIRMTPPMVEETLIFNDYHEGSYVLAFSHRLEGSKNHFLPIEVIEGQERQELLLPTFNHPSPFIYENSVYLCGKTLFSVKQQQGRISLALFSKLPGEKWKLNGEWEQEWRFSNQGVSVGYSQKGSQYNRISIMSLTNGGYCQFQTADLPSNRKVLDPKKYYTIDDLMMWAPSIPMIQKTIETEEL